MYLVGFEALGGACCDIGRFLQAFINMDGEATFQLTVLPLAERRVFYGPILLVA